MIKNIAIILLISVSQAYTTTSVLSQEYVSDKIEIQDKIFRANLSLQGVFFSYEKKLGKFIALYSDAGMSATFGHSVEFGSRWAVSPTIATECRWYFNYNSRQAKGKKMLFNAADFLSLQAGYIFRPIEKQSFAHIKSGYFLFSNIGMQRTWGKHINFELKCGLGLEYSDEYNSGGFAYNLNAKFGYIFNKTK